MLVHPSFGDPYVTITLRNDPVPGRPPTAVRDIVVRITSVCPCIVEHDLPVPGRVSVVGFTTLENGYESKGFGRSFTPTLGKFDTGTGLWRIPVLAPSAEAEIGFYPRSVSGFYAPRGRDVPHRVHAEIVSPVDPPGYRANNETEAWYVKIENRVWSGLALADAGVLARVANPAPDPGTQTTFEVTVKRHILPDPEGSITGRGRPQYGVWGVQVRVGVSPGLSIASTVEAPPGTSFDPDTGIWQLGSTESIPSEQTLEVPVVVASDAVPLVQRCLTATVVHALPSFMLEPYTFTQENDVATVCLGEGPRVVLNSGSHPESVLWSLHDCVGSTAQRDFANRDACDGESGVKVLAKLQRRLIESPSLLEGSLYGRLGGFDKPTVFLEPESVVVQVRDPDGRVSDFRSESVAPRGVSWQTGRDGSFNANVAQGLGVQWYRQGFNRSISSWDGLEPVVTVSGLDGAPAPGRVKIRKEDSSGTVEFDPNPSDQVTYDLTGNNSDRMSRPEKLFVEFETLGTYVVNYKLVADHRFFSDFSDSGDYVFHVGPVSELGVRDGGVSGLVGRGRRAFTVLAINDGPDAAGGVEVVLSGVPEGAEAVLTDGVYRETGCVGGVCEGVWDLGGLPVSGSRPLEGRSEFATLTLIPSGRAPASITATIAHTEPYSVCLNRASEVTPTVETEAACDAAGGEWHSTDYYDYVEGNDSVNVAGRFGTGAGVVGRPVVRAQLYTLPPIGLVSWDRVDVVNDQPVSHYQVWRTGAGCEPPGADVSPVVVRGMVLVDSGVDVTGRVCYFVRAVNVLGGAGYWSEGVLASSGRLVEPRLSVRGEPAVGEGSTVYFTVRAFPTPATGDPLTVFYTVSQQGDFLAAGESGRKQVILGHRGETLVFVQTDDDLVDEADGSVTVTLIDGAGYGLSSTRSATVGVTDNETSQVNFVLNQNAATVAEDTGQHDVPVEISPISAAGLRVDYTVGGTATVGDDFTIRGLTDGAGSVTASAGASRVNIPVRLVNDRVGEKTETIILTLKAGDDYDLFQPVTYTLSVTDDDGSSASFQTATGSVAEDGGTSGVVVDLVPAVTEDVTVNYRVSGGSGDFTIAGLTGGSGSVMASAGATSVTIPVSITDDALGEGDEEVVFTLQSGDGYTLGETLKHTLTIMDNDRPRAGFDSDVSTVMEDDGSYGVTVGLDQAAPAGGLTLRYDVAGTARSGSDFTITTSGTVTASEGATSVTIPISIIDDGVSEPDETVVLTLRPGSDYNLDATRVHTLTILANDLPLVFFGAGDARVDESTGVYRAVITLEPASHENLIINYTVGGTATAGGDYTIRNSGSVTARAGTKRVEIPFTILDDRVSEDEETIILTLSSGDGYNPLAGATDHTVTILDDDASVVSFDGVEGNVGEADGTYVVTVKLDHGLSTDMTVNYTVGGLATRGPTGDYTITDFGSVTIPAGARSAPIRININDEADPTAPGSYEGDETIILQLGTGSQYTVGTPDTYQVTILDNDPTPDGLPVVRNSHPGLRKPSGWGVCEVYEDQPFCRPVFYVDGGGQELGDVEVVVKYVGGTATLNEDFRIRNGPVVKGGLFTVTAKAASADAGGVTFARVDGFSPVRDQKREGDETVIFRVINGPGYTVEEGATDYTITIKDGN